MISEGALSVSIRVKVQRDVYLVKVGVAPRSSFCSQSSKDSRRRCRIWILDGRRAGRVVISVRDSNLV